MYNSIWNTGKRKYFHKVLPRVSGRPPRKSGKDDQQIYYPNNKKFELSNVSEEVIKKILLSLNTSKAAGLDQIPATFLKDGAE